MGAGTLQSGGGGGVTTDTKTTQTGDPDTKLNEIDIPDGATVQVERWVTAHTDDGSTLRTAGWHDRLLVTKDAGTIVDITVVQDDGVTNNKGSLFSASDISESAASGKLKQTGSSPSATTISNVGSVDISSVSGLPTGENKSGVGLRSNNKANYIFDDSNLGQMSHFPEGGSVEKVSDTQTATGIHVVDVVVDSNDVVHVAWVEATNSDLLYNNNRGGAFGTDVTVEDSVDTIRPSIDVDPSNNVHISYQNSTNSNLKYATNKDGNFTNEDVVTGKSVSNNAIYANGSTDVLIAFENTTDSNLGIAEGEKGFFSVDTSAYTSATSAFDIDKQPSGDTIVAHIDSGNVNVTTGTVSGGFSTNSGIASTNANFSQEGILVYASPTYNTVLFQGDSNGSDPYDVRVYDNSSGSYTFTGEFGQLGEAWTSQKNDEKITITDNGQGDQRIEKIVGPQTLNNLDINWRVSYALTD